MPDPLPRYDDDFFAWSQATAAAIRAGQRAGLDWEAIAEEVESLGKSDRREVLASLRTLCQGLLYWSYGTPACWEAMREHWIDRLYEALTALELIIEDSPSLRVQLPAFLAEAYAEAYPGTPPRHGAEDWATTPPATCPWSPAQVLDPDFWPEASRHA